MRHSSLVSLGLLLALFGCDDSGHPTLDTGVPSDTPIGELSPEQSAQVCEGTVALVNELAGPERQELIRCAVVGVVTELAGQGECSVARDNCLENGTTPPAEDIAVDCSDAPGTDFAGCEATIGQLEACANDLAAATDTVLDAFNCSLVDDPNALTDLEAELAGAVDPATHDSCAGLAEACLAFLDLPSVDVEVTIEP